MDIKYLPQEILERLYESNKKDMEGLDYFTTKFDEIFDTSCYNALSKKLNNTAHLLYKILMEYFIIESSVTNEELINTVMDGVYDSKKYPTLQSLQDKINEIRKGE